jgi:hypothetical protein
VIRNIFLTRAKVVECGSPLPLWLCALLVSVCLSGCSSLSPTGGSNATIDQLHLLVTSVALNMDGKPGPDGVGVRVYASHRGGSTALPITKGNLDILMFDGNAPLKELPSQKPLRTWAYPAEKLKPQLQETSVGTSYRFAAVWGDEKPKGERVTFVARYTPPGGPPVYSAPSSVPLALK